MALRGDSLTVKSFYWAVSYEIAFLNFSSMSWKLPVYSGKRIPQEAGALQKFSLYFKLLHKEPQAVFWHLFSCSGYCTASHPCLLILFPPFPALVLVVSTTSLWRMWQTRCQNWSALAATQRECGLKKSPLVLLFPSCEREQRGPGEWAGLIKYCIYSIAFIWLNIAYISHCCSFWLGGKLFLYFYQREIIFYIL